MIHYVCIPLGLEAEDAQILRGLASAKASITGAAREAGREMVEGSFRFQVTREKEGWMLTASAKTKGRKKK